MRTSWAFASWACSALLLAGCGDGASLTASGFAPGAGMQDVPDRRTNGSVDPVPTWRVEGGELSFSITLRNAGEDTLRVIAVARDEDGDDQQFVPGGVSPGVSLRPGATRRVVITGRHECNGRAAGQISRKSGQRFELAGRDPVEVELGALIEFVCPLDSPHP